MKGGKERRGEEKKWWKLQHLSFAQKEPKNFFLLNFVHSKQQEVKKDICEIK